MRSFFSFFLAHFAIFSNVLMQLIDAWLAVAKARTLLLHKNHSGAQDKKGLARIAALDKQSMTQRTTCRIAEAAQKVGQRVTRGRTMPVVHS